MSDLFSQSTISLLETPVKTNDQIPSEISFLDINLKAKVLLSQIAWVNAHRKTEYIPDLFLLQKHSSVQVRRQCIKTLENIGSREIVSEFSNWLNLEQDRATLLMLQNTVDKLSRQSNNLIKTKNILQVSEFLNTIKQLIGSSIFVVEGEVIEFNIYHQVVYFGLKDHKTGERVDCLAYHNVLDRLGFVLNEGLLIRVTGKASLAKNSSKLRLSVTFIDLTGEGEFLRNLKILKDKLTKEGLFDASRKRGIPSIPEKIILLTSRNSAAESDFIKVLNERRPGVEVFIIGIKTQGDGALRILLNCLRYLNEELANPNSSLASCQTVVITRGGGSKDDLNVFNQEQIVRAIYSLKIPTIVAIGHEKDFSLAELAADMRASTPTQAASMVSLSNLEIHTKVREIFIKNTLWMQKKHLSYESFNQAVFKKITGSIKIRLELISSVLAKQDFLFRNYLEDLQKKTILHFAAITAKLKDLVYKYSFTLQKTTLLSRDLKLKFTEYFQFTDNLYKQIHNLILQKFTQTEQLSRHLNSDINLYDYRKILQRGFAIVKDSQTQKYIEKWSDSKSKNFVVTLQDGSAQVILNEKKSLKL